MKDLTIGIISIFVTFAAYASGIRSYHQENLFIKMRPGKPLVASPYIKSSRNLIGDIYLVKSSNISALINEARGNNSIEYVEKDYYSTPRSGKVLERTPISGMEKSSAYELNYWRFNDPDANKLWGFGISNGMDVFGAYQFLPKIKPATVIVAVVDTGVDFTHEDLRSVMWVNSQEIPNDAIDNDNNGYVDDVFGINTLDRNAFGRPTGNILPSGQNGSFHGTHVAGTIAAKQNNDIGLIGVASNVKIMAIRSVPDSGDELDSNIVESFTYAAKNGAKIINCSFGKKVNEGGMVVRDTINEIGARYGVLVVTAAGNDASDNDSTFKYPASFDSANLLVVAAIDSTGALAKYSNFGRMTVDLAAPGSNIWSTLPGNNYGYSSGTSMATPNVSGVAAMVMGYFPQLKPTKVKKVLMDSAMKTYLLRGKTASGARVNLKQALRKAEFVIP